MNILIFEGIATSGKSTLMGRLQNEVKALVEVVGEPETHIPIMHETEKLHKQFFIGLVEKYLAQKPDLLIFDRLYLTQAFRAHVSLSQYVEVEELLRECNPRTIFLKVQEDAIAERTQKAAEHRDPSWKEYISTKGSSPEEIAQYYIQQQGHQLKLLEGSSLPYSIFDTTAHDYDRITQEIISLLK